MIRKARDYLGRVLCFSFSEGERCGRLSFAARLVCALRCAAGACLPATAPDLPWPVLRASLRGCGAANDGCGERLLCGLDGRLQLSLEGLVAPARLLHLPESPGERGLGGA